MTTAELIEKLERADGPERELFALAFEALQPGIERADWLESAAKFYRFLDAEAWESAAMTLVPEGWTGFVAVCADNETWLWPCDGTMGRGFRITHKFPAIALCIAALRAKEADNG